MYYFYPNSNTVVVSSTLLINLYLKLISIYAVLRFGRSNTSHDVGVYIISRYTAASYQCWHFTPSDLLCYSLQISHVGLMWSELSNWKPLCSSLTASRHTYMLTLTRPQSVAGVRCAPTCSFSDISTVIKAHNVSPTFKYTITRKMSQKQALILRKVLENRNKNHVSAWPSPKPNLTCYHLVRLLCENWYRGNEFGVWLMTKHFRNLLVRGQVNGSLGKKSVVLFNYKTFVHRFK